MGLAAGTRLGPYEVGSSIGAGGMGEVYRARDTRLDRDVAIKVLPEEFAQDEERRLRFEREAKLLASLNHPNIASIHGFEESESLQRALVLELVEGPTLAERIQEGPIPIEETIGIAGQIADALEAGHEAGVIHRDLKPANVKVKEDGTVKVLDYGLAKALEGEAGGGVDSELSQSPTLTRQGTQLGMILGTAAYMSPEQAKGKRVDRRTDVWAFGAVVYEMLTGKRAFAGEDVSDTLAAVLRAEPDLEALPVETPHAVRNVLELCLTKDMHERVRDIADVRLAMQGAFAARPGQEPDSPSARVGPAWLIATLAALAGLVGGWAIDHFDEPGPARTPTRLTLTSPPLAVSRGRVVGISRDGKRIAFTAENQIWLRDLQEHEASPMDDTLGARKPFFSPDGEWVGFDIDGELRKVSVNGGRSVPVAATARSRGAWWQDDGSIVFATQAGIMRVADTGGDPEVLVVPSSGIPFDPQVLPGGGAVLYTLRGRSPGSRVVAQTLPDGEARVLVEDATSGRYLPSGHLVYVQSGTIFGVGFDPSALVLQGNPVPLVDEVRPSFATSHFDVSETGTLVYLRGGASYERRLVWVDREGRDEPLPLEPSNFHIVRLSPDGTRLAFSGIVADTPDVWLYELSTRTRSRFTFDPAGDSDPVWSPDGTRIYFASTRHSGVTDIYWKPSDGSGGAVQLTQSEAQQWPQFVTPDGSVLVIDEIGLETSTDILQLAVDGLEEASDSPATTELQPFLRTEATERLPSISRDGRFVAYEMDDVSTREIYVRRFPEGDGPWQVSDGGGVSPVWSPDGTELFYFVGDALTAASVETEPTFRVTGTSVLFEGQYVKQSHSYDVSHDGERFLMIREAGATSSFVVVLDWFEELKRLVPVDD